MLAEEEHRGNKEDSLLSTTSLSSPDRVILKANKRRIDKTRFL